VALLCSANGNPMPTAGRRIIRNHLLSGLPAAELAQLLPELHAINWPMRQSLYEVTNKIEQVYFVEQGLASIVVIMADGSTSEVGMIGPEGMLDISLLLGADTSAQHALVQIPGGALRMSAAVCKAAFERLPAFRVGVLCFIGAFLGLSAQTAACNRLHSATERCARWLLMASDRIESDTFPMTHEFLASMLGVRRTGVTAIARDLQRSKLIQYQHGRITITDRDGLAAAACECYSVDHQRLRQLLSRISPARA
jgi:CRP-like cAMP-binding protein